MRRGQSLILITVIIGGIFMVVTAVAGLLMFYQVQQSGDAQRSTIAILAADAGLERTLRFWYHEFTGDPDQCRQVCTSETPEPPGATYDFSVLAGRLENGATYEGSIFIRAGTSCEERTITATGRDRSRRTIRTLQVIFQNC